MSMWVASHYPDIPKGCLTVDVSSACPTLMGMREKRGEGIHIC